MKAALTLLVSGVQIYEIYLIYQCFFARSKFTAKYMFAAYFLVFAVCSGQYLNVNIPVLNTFISFLGLFCLTLLYEAEWKNRVTAFFFNFAAMFAAEAIVSAIFGYVDAELFTEREYYSYFGMVCLPLVQFLIVLLIRNFRNLHCREDVPTSYWIISVVLPVLSFYIYFQICLRHDISKVNLLGSSVAVLLLNILVIFLYDRQIKASLLEREKESLELQNKYQERQYNLMSESVERLQKHRHDFRNHLQSIAYIGEQNDWPAMSSYINHLEEHFLENDTYIYTGSVIFDGVLNYKLQEANKKGIDMQVDIKIPSDIVIVPCDVTTILGNLLDNSIEATAGQEESWIKANIFYRSGRLNLLITNTFNNDLVRNGDWYRTSKADSDKHGFGLKNVQEVVERYEGIMETNAENGIFSVKITLYL